METFKDFLFDTLDIKREPVDLESFLKKYNWKRSYIPTIEYLEYRSSMIRYYNLMSRMSYNPFETY